MEKGKLIEKEWKDEKLKIMINDSINIEKNNQNINKINEYIKNYNSKNFNFIINNIYFSYIIFNIYTIIYKRI